MKWIIGEFEPPQSTFPSNCQGCLLQRLTKKSTTLGMAITRMQRTQQWLTFARQWHLVDATGQVDACDIRMIHYKWVLSARWAVSRINLRGISDISLKIIGQIYERFENQRVGGRNRAAYRMFGILVRRLQIICLANTNLYTILLRTVAIMWLSLTAKMWRCMRSTGNISSFTSTKSVMILGVECHAFGYMLPPNSLFQIS